MDEIIPRATTRQSLKNESVRTEARQMYYSGILPLEIASTLQVDSKELSRLIFGEDGSGRDGRSWYAKKRKRDDYYGKNKAISVPGYEKVKSYVLRQTEARLLRMVQKSLDDMETDGVVFEDVDSIKKAIETMGKLDAITRLEEGKPTQIIEMDHGLSLREVEQEYGKRVPTTIEVEVKDVE